MGRMRLATRSGAVVLLAGSLLWPTAGPRAADEAIDRGFAEEVTIRRHLVDVVVRNRDGSPAIGLGPEDFEVRINGADREVLTLDRSDQGWRPASASSGAKALDMPRAASPVARRWVLILLDADRIPLNYRKLAMDTARNVVERNASPGTAFAVLLLKGGRAEYLQPFAAAAEVDPSLFERPDLLLGTSTDLEVRLRDLLERMDTCASDRRRDAVGLQACVRQASAEFLQELRRESNLGLGSLQTVLAALAPLPGRKALVLLSSGFALRPADVVLETLREISLDAWERMRSYLEDDPPRLYDEVLAQATASGVSIFALRTGRDLSASFSGADRGRPGNDTARAGLAPYREAALMVDESLRDAAEATGGRAVLSQLAPGVTEGLFQTLDGVYTLGLAALPEDGSDPKIRVRVRGPYRVDAPRRLGRIAEPRATLGGLLQIEPPSPQSGGKYAARLDLRADTVPPIAEDEPVSRLALYFRLLDEARTPVADAYRIVEFPRDGPPADTLIHRIPFDAAPGRAYVAEVFATELARGARGFFSTSFELPPAR